MGVEADRDRGITHQIYRQAAAHAQLHVEEVLRSAINLYIGHDRWTLDDLKGRVTKTRLQDGREFYLIDGVKLAVFHPLRADRVYKGGNIALEVEREYKVLFTGGQLEEGRGCKNQQSKWVKRMSTAAPDERRGPY